MFNQVGHTVIVKSYAQKIGQSEPAPTQHTIHWMDDAVMTQLWMNLKWVDNWFHFDEPIPQDIGLKCR
jgi:hypothetical protein